jgi:PAS domain S-box-containing protein
MREGYEEGCPSAEETLRLRARVAELEGANERLRQRVTALESERDAILDAITEAILVVDRAGTLQAVNRTAACWLGRAKEDLRGLNGRDCARGAVPAEVCDAAFGHLATAISGGKPVRVTNEYVGRMYDQVYYPVVDAAGQVTHVVFFASDITARTQVEKQLADSRQRYQDLIDNMNDIVYTNRAVERIFGFPPGQVVGTHYSRWFPETELPKLKRARRDVLDGKRATIQLAVLDKEGRERYVETSVSPLVGDGRIIGTQGMIRDITGRREAERTIRESEEMLRALFNATTESIFLLDRTGTVLMLNETAARRFGKSPGELIGTRIADVGEDRFPAAVVEDRTRRISEVLRTQQAVRFEDERAGRYYDTSAYPVFDETGTVQRMAIFGKDITERKRAEEHVRDLQRRIEFILGAAKTGLNITDAGFNLRYVDPAWRKIYGEYQGKKCYEYFLNADHVCPGCGVPKALATRQVTVYDGVLPKEGNRPIQVTAIPFQEENGEWLLAEVNVDITERKQLEEQLRASEQRYRAVVEGAGEAIAAVDAQGVFQFLNTTAGRRLGGQPADFVGKSMWELFPREVAEPQMAHVREVIASGRGRSVISLADVNGELRWYNTTVEPLRDSAGAITAGLVIARDIHEFRTAQQELETYREKMAGAERLASLGTLSASLSHELTQPLTVIRLSIQNALKDLETVSCDKRIREYLNDGLAETAQVTAIVDRFRNFARRASEKMVSKVVLAETARRVLHLLEESARRARVTLETHGLEGLPAIYAHAKDIEQVFFALAQNAIQAADGARDRRLCISGARRGEQIELRFADGCGGIAPEHLSRLFEPFFTTKRPGEGTGLGLCIVQRLVSQAGGHLRVDSQPGAGTSFFITLPIEEKWSMGGESDDGNP